MIRTPFSGPVALEANWRVLGKFKPPLASESFPGADDARVFYPYSEANEGEKRDGTREPG
jgi:hypothetical protein